VSAGERFRRLDPFERPNNRARLNLFPIEDIWRKKTMASSKPIKKIAIVGTGVIGASWAAEFLARGFDVVATDPAPDAEKNLHKFVDAAWPALTAKGLSKGGSRKRLSFSLDMKQALSDADFVQENGPELPEFKIKLFADMDGATPSDSLIASSSSGITMSVMQSACKNPERCVIGHPFNPPHMVPLVEVVGGSKTSDEAVKQAIDFYTSIGKKPIHVRKEVAGHVANRLQAAIYREVVNLIHFGVVDVADADTAVCWGPGLRWGIMGPSMLFHLGGGQGGGQGGIQHFMEHLSGPVATWWKDLGSFTEWPEGSKQTIVDGVLKDANGRSIDELEEMRDDLLLELVKLRMLQVGAAVQTK
jgi:3-hydroxyacyl-CoA dehydrogenase